MKSSSHFESRLPIEEICWEPHFDADDVRILDVEVSRITVGRPENGEQTLKIEFAQPQAEEAVDHFLQNLAIGLSVEMAPRQRDGWNGILFAEIPLADAKLQKKTIQSGIRVTDSLGIESISPQPISKEILANLRSSPLAEIFVDGMKAPDIKAKFIYWFVMLEELERLAEFDTLFTRLFEKDDIEAVVTNSGLTGSKLERFKGWVNGRNLTVEGRPEKLRLILSSIGFTKVETVDGEVPITNELCRSLIEQRNKVAHRGSKIDPMTVYKVLYPLAHGALLELQSKESAACA